MNIIFLYPHALLFLLGLPILKVANRKYTCQPSILVPNMLLLKKIIGDNSKPQTHFLLHCRMLAVLLLLLAYSEPMIVLETQIMRCNYYLIATSLVCFLLEIFLRNTLLQKIP
ncbi:MAG: BatA domain-containing protein [Puniceicoccales bacterium]|nr:BatA domain-containing protein [Puniceicoccales bacterium]